MKLTNSTIAATFAALLIGGLAINPASAKVHPSHYNETGRVAPKVTPKRYSTANLQIGPTVVKVEFALANERGGY